MNEPLRYEPLSLEHLDGLAALWADPEVIRYTNVKSPCTRRESRDKLERLLENQRDGPVPTVFTVWEETRVCGVAGCPAVNWASAEFGLFYQFARPCWGRGIGGASAAWLVAHMRRAFPGGTLSADVVANNAASVRILERLGFSFRRRREAVFPCQGALLDILDYHLKL